MGVSGECLPNAERDECHRGEGRNEKAGHPMARDALEHFVPSFPFGSSSASVTEPSREPVKERLASGKCLA
jgi:hypothetical protein